MSAGSQAFVKAWRATQGDASVQHFLASSRTIVVPPDQVVALPGQGVPDEIRLPFPATFLDLGGVHVDSDGQAHREAFDLESAGFGKVEGVLLLDAKSGAGHVDFDSHPVHAAWFASSNTGETVAIPLGGAAPLSESPWAGLVGAVVGLLQSANVSLVDLPVSRQVRRAAERSGAPIALTVAIRTPTRRSKPGESGDQVEFSHRFEVRGNFAHHFELTAKGEPNRLFERWSVEKPEKVITIGGKPCVRIWRPPYVKGPEDKPLIPKLRTVERAVSGSLAGRGQEHPDTALSNREECPR